jgi:hypothetical protein
VVGLAILIAGGVFGFRKYKAAKEFSEYQKSQEKTAKALNPGMQMQNPVDFDPQLYANQPVVNDLYPTPDTAMNMGMGRASWSDQTAMLGGDPMSGMAAYGDGFGGSTFNGSAAFNGGTFGGGGGGGTFNGGGGGGAARATMVDGSYDAVW